MAGTATPDYETFQPRGPESPSSLTPPTAPPEEGKLGIRLLIAAVVVVILAGGAFGLMSLVSSGGTSTADSMLTAPVIRGDMLVTVTEDGNLESAANIDIKCEVAGGTSILWIVEDGKEVKEGEKLVELDASALEEQINQQRITFEKSRAAKIQAEKDFAAAKLAVQEYLEGTFVQLLQDQDAQITISEENLRTAQNTLEHSQRMFRKGYISSLDLESQQFAVQRAQLELDSARTARDVLVKYTKEKTLQDLESKRDSAEAQARSEGASYDLEQSRLQRLESQLEHCMIKAPADGMVVYAKQQSGRMGGSQQAQIEEGAMVRERQTILMLPDLSLMQVKVNVHESKIEMLGRAMRTAQQKGEALGASIKIQDLEFPGTLSSIANQPEPSGWWTGNVKEYATIIAIAGKPKGLRPGMTAECEVLIDHVKDVLQVPVAAVVEQRGGYFCWVKTDKGPERRPLVLGVTNDLYVEVNDGVKDGEQVVLNPRAMIPEARAVKEDTGEGNGKDASKKFGKGKAPAGAASSGPSGMMKGGGGQGGERGGGRDHGGGGRPSGGGAAGGGPSFDLMSLDKDGDGKVSKDEAPSQMQRFFDMIDTNKDGFIDKGESASMRSRMKSGGGRPGGGGGRGAPKTKSTGE